MNISSVALVLAAVAVNFGWQPSKEDPQAYEVLMQVEPELVDVMADGTALPIESHVPKEVAPIRNIRVVVGKEQLPRTMIVTEQDARPAPKPASDRIVRGQEPIEHTANFQADTWGASSPNRRFEQRNATIGSSVPSPPANNPWTVQNAQQSLNNAGNSLTNSVSSSIDQVTNQFNQTGQDLYNKTKDAAGDFGNQLQNTMSLSSQSGTPATTSSPPSARYAPAPPLTSTLNAATTPTNWTTINPSLAPPRLTPPPLANGIRVASNPAAGSTNVGPAFPPPPTVAASGERSMLSNSQPASSRESDGDWNSVWGTTPSTPATIGSDADATGMVPVPPRVRTSATSSSPPLQSPPASNSGLATAPLDQRYQGVNLPPPSSPSNSGADDWANFRGPQDNVFNDPRMPAASQQPTMASQQSPPNQSPIAQAPTPEPPAIQAAGTNQPPVTAPAEEVPWKPLLAVSLALAGSIGANFYLGMSYAEARHRYRTLVAKTTHAFEKKAGLAA